MGLMDKENFFDVKAALSFLKKLWDNAFWPVMLAITGFFFGIADAEQRIIGDCKYAQAFRVAQQAFSCQRKI